ncbi:hypothetical protein AWB76_07513 [Caballeronia temeraria]|uniref:Uncharacterized protein n=1 Tax=Caballeronia temeraria TaxID=1777137 RepID=A0A158DX30_9BURK|nr:hypothetical protein [Caballeronia temeraria]SAK98277.1 hypothetical protein AWB76_07513 [Caballeronia temeraria]
MPIGGPVNMASRAQLSDVQTLDDVQSLTDIKTFAQEEAYFHEGTVSRCDESGGALRANVNGTSSYSVRFEQRPDAEGFAALIEVVRATDSVDHARERAFGLMWAQVKKEKASVAVGKSVWLRPRSRTDIVEIHLALKEPDKAWAAFAGGPVATNMWARMASIRAKTHPAMQSLYITACYQLRRRKAQGKLATKTKRPSDCP